MITATIQAINKLSTQNMQVDVFYSDGSISNLTLAIDATSAEIRAAIADELRTKNDAENKVANLRAELLNTVIEVE